MVQADVINEQLRQLGVNVRFWNKPEIKELPRILFEHEQLTHVVTGRYEGGFALLVSTNMRVLLIDKKPFFLTLEDIRYDRISDVQLNHRLLDATICLGSITKNLTFTGYNPSKLRDMTSYIQERVMQTRQARQGTMADTLEPRESVPLVQAVPLPAAQLTQQTTTDTVPAKTDWLNRGWKTTSLVPDLASGDTVPALPTDHATNTPMASSLLDEPMIYDHKMTDEQREAIGRIAVMPSGTEHPNPYRSPLVFRRRVSRFY